MQAGGPGGDPSGWMGDLTNLAQLGGGIYGLINAGQTSSQANTAVEQSNPFGAYRPQFAQQLVQLMQNPGSVTSLPGYQFLLDQGTTAIDRSAAAPGGKGLGSGGEMTDLATFGQGLASQFYNQQIQTLSGLAGANIAPSSPAAALTAKGGAATSVGSSIAGLTSTLPGTLNMLQRFFPNQDLTNSGVTQTNDPGGFNGLFDSMGGGTPGGNVTDTASGTSTYFGDDGGGGMDLSGLWSDPKTAGGEAATTGTNLGGLLKTGGQIAGIGLDLAQGGVTGNIAAGAGIASLASKNAGALGISSSAAKDLSIGAGGIGDVLGIYSGLKAGGAQGDVQAALSAYNLYNLATTAGTTAGSGAAAGASGIGIGAGLAVGLVADLATGLLSGTGHPIYQVAGADAQAWTNDWLNKSGPGLKMISGTGGPGTTYYLKDGTSISGDQYQQLQAMTQQFMVKNNAQTGALGSNRDLTDEQSAELETFLKSSATKSDPSMAAWGNPTPSNTNLYANLSDAQFQQMQHFYGG